MAELLSPTGVLGDPRKDERVINGFKSTELLAATAPLMWLERPDSALKQRPIMNQNGSSACVAFSKAKQLSLAIEKQTGVYIEFSPASIYQLRSNRPGLGMAISDANDIVNKKGATLEALMKSQNLTEDQIHAVKKSKVAGLFADAIAEAVVSYVYVPVSIDQIAQVIEQKNGVSLLLFANFDEYDSDPQINNLNLTYENAQIRHEVVALDYMLRNGKKCLWIEDSWGIGNGIGGRRVFTEDFLEKRVILADYLAVLNFDGEQGIKPKYDGTIISLQKCLKWEGLLAQEVVEVENYGPMTRVAVIRFQRKYGIEPSVGNFGPITRAKVKELYP